MVEFKLILTKRIKAFSGFRFKAAGVETSVIPYKAHGNKLQCCAKSINH